MSDIDKFMLCRHDDCCDRMRERVSDALDAERAKRKRAERAWARVVEAGQDPEILLARAERAEAELDTPKALIRSQDNAMSDLDAEVERLRGMLGVAENRLRLDADAADAVLAWRYETGERRVFPSTSVEMVARHAREVAGDINAALARKDDHA